MANTSPSSVRWQAFLLLVIAIVGPPTALLTFSHTLKPSVPITLIIISAYELFIFIVSIIAKVWKRLEEPWIDQIADGLRTRMRWAINRPKAKYRQFMFYQHRDFYDKGLNTQGEYTLKIEQVFVDLNIISIPMHQSSADPLQIQPMFTEKAHPIWYYLSAKTLKEQHFVIIGPPGSGKTTLLKHMVLATLKQHKPAFIKYLIPFSLFRDVSKQGQKIQHRLPILLFLRDHAEKIKENQDVSLEELVQKQLKKWWKQTLPTGWIQHQLDKGACFIFLDGYDEVADGEMRKYVADWVEQQMSAYGPNRFIVTSRPHGYKSHPLSKVTVLQVKAFTTKQIGLFIHNWYTANEIMSSQRDDRGVRMRAQNGAEDLLARLRSTPTLLELAVNPLLLTMIATIHRYRHTLPGKRVGLYNEICDVFLSKRQEAKGIRMELTAVQQRQVLQPLAYYMMKQRIRDIDPGNASHVIADSLTQVGSLLHPNTFLKFVENNSGLLLEREQGMYSFTHLTFQEYLAAAYIKENSLEKVIIKQVTDSWWHETIRLYCAQSDASIIIDACLEGIPSVSKLTLALECQQEALKIHQSSKARLETFLLQRIEDPIREMRQLVGEARLSQRLNAMVQFNEGIYISKSLITNAEYQNFLDERNSREYPCQPDHWKMGIFPSGNGNNAVLGIRHPDALTFCDWLTQRSNGVWYYRLPSETELKEIEDNRSQLLTILANTGYWTQTGNIGIKKEPYTLDQARQAIQKVLQYDNNTARNIDTHNALTHTRTFDLHLSRVLMRTTKSFIARSHTFSHSFALRLQDTIIHKRSNDRIRALEKLLTQAYAADFSFYRPFELALDLEKTRCRTQEIDERLHLWLRHWHALGFPLTSAYINERDQHILSPTLFLALDLNSNAMPDFILDDLPIIDFNLGLDIDINAALDFDQYLNQYINLRSTTSYPDLILAIYFSLSLISDIIYIYNNIRELSNKDAVFFRWYLRFSTHTLARYCLRIIEIDNSNGLTVRLHASGLRKKEVLSRIINYALETYTILALVEERYQNRFPTWEGILLIKERKKDIP